MICKPYKIIKLDRYTHKIPSPTLLLMTRSFDVIGKIPRYENWNMSLVGNGIDEISFTVTKYLNGILNPVWDDLIDLKVIEVRDFGRFEITVNYTDNTKTEKVVHGQSLKVELSQIYLHDFHVNDEDAMSMEITQYNENDFDTNGNFIPTVFYDENDEKHSLLNRVIADKAPHWKIGYVTPYITLSEEDEPESSDTFQRTYTGEGVSIYDFLTGDVAKESNVIFVFDTINREINCYSLCDCIKQETGELLVQGIGEDTTILVSKRKLANEIAISSNKDNVKNCFRVEGGDEIITDMIRVANVNGSNYIYQFADFQYKDMPKALVDKLKRYHEEIIQQSDTYYGENGIYTGLCKKYDDLVYYESSMMPDVSIEDTTAEEQYTAMVNSLKTTVIGVSSVNNYSNNLFLGVSNNVEAMANIMIDARYNAKIIEGSTSYNSSTHKWTGNFQVTRIADDTDYYPKTSEGMAATFEVSISDDELTFTRQKVDKALAKGSMLDIDFEVKNMSSVEMKAYFSQYSLNRLKSFYDGYNSCLSVLMSLNTKTSDTPSSDTYTTLYEEYHKRMEIVESLRNERQLQVDSINAEIDALLKEQKAFQDTWNFEKYLGTDLYKIFCSYRREDSYVNNNYISDGLSTSECVTKAKELIDAATKELKKACVLQRTVTVNLNNLFALPEFEPLYDKFALFNYIRIRTDDEILKLRLIGIDFSGDSVSEITVTFSEQIESIDGKMSDLQSIIQQASSMSTSYPSTALQAKKGEQAKNTFNEIYSKGLNAAKTTLSNNDHNEVSITSAGIIGKRMDDEGFYGDKQFRITGNMFAFTKDNWRTVELAIGETVFQNPLTGEYEERYGIFASAIVGKLVVGENMYIGNQDGTVEITGKGIKITNGTITWGNDSVNAPEMDDINGLAKSLEDINTNFEQLDGRIQTYAQSDNPKTATNTKWNDSENEKHVNDVWINTSNGITYIFKKTGNTYDWMETHDSNLKSIAISKAQIFTSKQATITNGYQVGDLWILESNTVMSGCKKGTVLVSNSNAQANNTFTSNHWTEITVKEASEALQKVNNISDDSKVTPSEKQQLKLIQIDIISECLRIDSLTRKYNMDYDIKLATYTDRYDKLISYLDDLLRDLNTTTDIVKADFDKVFKEYYDARDVIIEIIDTAEKKYVDDNIENVENNISNFKEKVNAALMGNATTEIGNDYIISPKIGGGYLYIANNNYSVEIDPNHKSTSTLNGYLFCVKNKSKNETVMGVTTQGDGYFKGTITGSDIVGSSGQFTKSFEVSTPIASDNESFSSYKWVMKANTDGVIIGAETDSQDPQAPKSSIKFNEGVKGISVSTSGGDVIISATRGSIILKPIGAGSVVIEGNLNIDGDLIVKGKKIA